MPRNCLGTCLEGPLRECHCAGLSPRRYSPDPFGALNLSLPGGGAHVGPPVSLRIRSPSLYIYRTLYLQFLSRRFTTEGNRAVLLETFSLCSLYSAGLMILNCRRFCKADNNTRRNIRGGTGRSVREVADNSFGKAPSRCVSHKLAYFSTERIALLNRPARQFGRSL